MCRLTFMMMALVSLMLALVSGFQVPIPSITINTRGNISVYVFRHRGGHPITAVSNSRSKTEKLQNPRQSNKCTIYLRNSNNDQQENEREEEEKESENVNNNPIQPQSKNFLDKVWESPIFTSFLFWTPFVANPKLRQRFSNFLSEYLDVQIAIPASVVGIMGVILYVSYQNRLRDIELASSVTEESLRQMREIRKSQMTASCTSSSGENNFEKALQNYEYLLREELRLRYTFGALPLKVPNEIEGPDKGAAKLFLGMEINESGDLINWPY